jgi:hypothetical protein
LARSIGHGAVTGSTAQTQQSQASLTWRMTGDAGVGETAAEVTEAEDIGTDGTGIA